MLNKVYTVPISGVKLESVDDAPKRFLPIIKMTKDDDNFTYFLVGTADYVRAHSQTFLCVVNHCMHDLVNVCFCRILYYLKDTLNACMHVLY